MEVYEIRPHQLTDDLVRQWEELRRTDHALASPFFASDLARMLGEVRDDLRIGVVEEGGQPVAFVPFHRGAFRTGLVMGWPWMDYHGLIADPRLDLDLRQVVRGLGLSRLRFLCVPANQHWFRPYVTATEPSPMICIDQFRSSSKDTRKLRKLEREVGPIDFNVSAARGADLEQLLGWKQDQVKRTDFYPVFSYPWLTPLLRRLPQYTGANFAGLFTTLKAGDRLIAAHLGIPSDTIWHWWFPAYDPSFRAYSPGLMLLHLSARAAPQMGIQWIDFGNGPEDFKRRLANDQRFLVHGTVTSGWASAGFTQSRQAAVTTVRRLGLQKKARRLRAAFQGGLHSVYGHLLTLALTMAVW